MRSWIGLSLALVVGGGLAALHAAAADEPVEMVRSGGFEEGEAIPGLGRFWLSQSYGGANVQFTLDTDNAQLGKYCQRIRVTDFKKGGTQICQSGVKLAKGQPYTITLWMRGTISAPVTVGFRKKPAPYTYYVKSDVRVTPAWQRFTITGTATEEDADAGLYIHFTGDGDLWIDGVSAKRGGTETRTASQ
jgi:hypothetical protein